MATAIAFETFDIASERPFSRDRIHLSSKTPGGIGPVFHRRLDDRIENIIEVNVKTGGPMKLRRLLHLYNATFFGTMPMTYVHADLGTILVVFDEPESVISLANYAVSSYVIRLREWTGGYG